MKKPEEIQELLECYSIDGPAGNISDDCEGGFCEICPFNIPSSNPDKCLDEILDTYEMFNIYRYLIGNVYSWRDINAIRKMIIAQLTPEQREKIGV